MSSIFKYTQWRRHTHTESYDPVHCSLRSSRLSLRRSWGPGPGGPSVPRREARVSTEHARTIMHVCVFLSASAELRSAFWDTYSIQTQRV